MSFPVSRRIGSIDYSHRGTFRIEHAFTQRLIPTREPDGNCLARMALAGSQ